MSLFLGPTRLFFHGGPYKPSRVYRNISAGSFLSNKDKLRCQLQSTRHWTHRRPPLFDAHSLMLPFSSTRSLSRMACKFRKCQRNAPSIHLIETRVERRERRDDDGSGKHESRGYWTVVGGKVRSLSVCLLSPSATNMEGISSSM